MRYAKQKGKISFQYLTTNLHIYFMKKNYAQHSNDNQQEENTAEEMESEVFIKRQTKFFDQLKRFLTAQQISLKQNLTLLETKTVKIKEHRVTGPSVESESFNGAQSRRTEDDDMVRAHESTVLDALNQWGSPSDDTGTATKV